jgi:hypothetical protein
LDKRILTAGILLIVIAIMLFVVQHFYFGPNNQSLYGDDENKWYFYGLIGIIGLIGLTLAAWSYMRKMPKQ